MDINPAPPVSTPPPAPKRRMNPAVVAGIVALVLLVGYGAYAYFTGSWPFAPAGEPMASGSPTPAAAPWQTYENATAGYAYEYPPGWNAVTSQFIPLNSLFGPGATSSTGRGGVEIQNNYGGSIESFLAQYQDQVSERQDVVIANRAGVRIRFSDQGTVVSAVVFKRDDQLINIYLRDGTEAELELFARLLASFRFTSPAADTTRVADRASTYTVELPRDWEIRHEGTTGTQLSRLTAERPDWRLRSEKGDEFCSSLQHVEAGARFTATVNTVELQPTDHPGEGGSGIRSTKNVEIDGVNGTFHVYDQMCVTGRFLDVHVNFGGKSYLFDFWYNADLYPQGEAVFMDILATIKFTR